MDKSHTSTASSSVIVAYDVTDLTMLRYYTPFIKRVVQVRDDVMHVLAFDRRNTKYNGLHAEQNKAKYDVIVADLRRLGNVRSVEQRDVVCDTFVSVESTSSNVRHERHVAIAHGLDCVTHAKTLTMCDAYICSPHVAALEYVRGLPTMSPTCPMSLLTHGELRDWASANIIAHSGRSTVTVFYPDRGHRQLADAVISQLAKTCDVYVKQRRKWQDVTAVEAHRIVYDDVWVPAEAIALPLATDVTLGFGSTAYIDLIEANVEYVDVDIWCTSIRPAVTNYTCLPASVLAGDVVDAVMTRVQHRRCMPTFDIPEFDDLLHCIVG